MLRSQTLEKLQRAPKPPRTFSGTFSRTLLNLTWLCTKASQTFSGTKASQTFTGPFSGILLNLTSLCTKASQTFAGTFSGTFSGTLLNLTWLCTKASQTFSGTFGTFSGTLLNLTQRLHQCTPELFWAEDPISLRCWGKICKNVKTSTSEISTPKSCNCSVKTKSWVEWCSSLENASKLVVDRHASCLSSISLGNVRNTNKNWRGMVALLSLWEK